MKLLYCIGLICTLLLQVHTQMIPGACLEGQTDDQTHTPDQYSPVLYTIPPTNGVVRAPSPAPTLRFMSYNIQSTLSLYCVEALSNQTEYVAFVNPDFVGFQETDIDVDIRCNCNIPQVVADTLGYNAYFMMMFPWRNGKYGDTAATAFDVLALEYIYFNVSNNYFEQRGALAHLVQPPQLQGRYMWYINTHMEYSSLDVRIIQCNQLVAWIETLLLVQYPTALVVITGDFYALPGDDSYSTLASYLSNAWAVYSGSTDNGYTHPSDYPTTRFDHIWFKVPADGTLTVTVTNFTIPAITLSDHRPIFAEFSFETSSAWTNPTSSGTLTGSTSGTAASGSVSTATITGASATATTGSATSGSAPTTAPTVAPPTTAPTAAPTAAPSSTPTVAPTSAPTVAPTSAPATTVDPPPTVTVTTAQPTKASGTGENNVGGESGETLPTKQPSPTTNKGTSKPSSGTRVFAGLLTLVTSLVLPLLL